MKRNVIGVFAVSILLSSAAIAGSIHGKVSGVTGESVVFVEAVAGKTFPAPTQSVVIDQKGLMFMPHLTAVQQGTTVDFLNSDSVAHNVFWTSVGGNKKLGHNLGTWPRGRRSRSSLMIPAQCHCYATYIQRCRLTSSCHRLLTSPSRTNQANTRLRTFLMAATQ